MKVNDERRFFSLLFTSTFYFSIFHFLLPRFLRRPVHTPLPCGGRRRCRSGHGDRSFRPVRARPHGRPVRDFRRGTRRPVVQFSAGRVPVSLGILLDISGSMTESPSARAADDARWSDTRHALELLLARLTAADEVFFAAFSDKVAAAPWTNDRAAILRVIDLLQPGGGTALLDAIRLILPAFQRARYQRKVLLLISDGNDTSLPAAGVVDPYLLRHDSEIEPVARLGQSQQTQRQRSSIHEGRRAQVRRDCCMPSASARARARRWIRCCSRV